MHLRQGAHVSVLVIYLARLIKFGGPLQESFDAAVQENIVEFDMTVSTSELIAGC